MNKMALILLLCCSCARLPQSFYNGTAIPRYVDPYFIPLIEQFKIDTTIAQLGQGAIFSLTVYRFDDNFTSNQVAKCVYEHETQPGLYDNFHKEIVFDPVIKTYCPQLQYKIFLHEMGHCVYNLVHNNTDRQAIMFPSVTYYKNEDWINEKADYFAAAENNIDNWGNTTILGK